MIRRCSCIFLIVFLCAPLARISFGEKKPLKQFFLPVLYKHNGLKLTDCDNNPWTWEELREMFGAVTICEGDGAQLTELSCDASGIAALSAYVEEGTIVIRYWPGAPELPEELQGWYNNGVYAVAGEEGRVDFPLGFGDYYFPPSGGASCMWVHPDSDMVCGLGMLGGTNHIHLDMKWR